MLKYALLGFLSYTPMSGYELKQRIDRSTAHFWHAKLSQIYVTLKTLEQENLINSTVQEQSDRPDRRVYTMTPAGQREFQTWLAEPYTELSPKKETLVLKMFFAARMEKPIALAQLHIQLELHKKQLMYYQQDVLSSIQHATTEFPQLTGDAKMWEATRRFGEKYEITYVQWIEEMIQMLA